METSTKTEEEEVLMYVKFTTSDGGCGGMLPCGIPHAPQDAAGFATSGTFCSREAPFPDGAERRHVGEMAYLHADDALPWLMRMEQWTTMWDVELPDQQPFAGMREGVICWADQFTLSNPRPIPEAMRLACVKVTSFALYFIPLKDKTEAIVAAANERALEETKEALDHWSSVQCRVKLGIASRSIGE